MTVVFDRGNPSVAQILESFDGYRRGPLLRSGNVEAGGRTSHASIALMHLGRAVEAGAALKAAIDIDGGYSDAHCRLGSVYLRLGHRDEAKQAYLTALSLAPGDSDIPANLRAVDHGR